MSIRLFRHYVQLPIVLLIVLEAAVALLALSVTCRWEIPVLPQMAGAPWRDFMVFAGVLGLTSGAMGLYNARLRDRMSGIALRLVFSALAAIAALSVLSLAIADFEVTFRHFALALALAVALDFALRFGFNKLLDEDLLKRRVLVYGAGQHAQSIAGLKRRSDRIGFNIVGFVRDNGMDTVVPQSRLVEPGHLLAWCKANDVDEIVVAMDDRRRAFPVHDLLECRLHGIEVIEVLSFLERETGKIRLDVLHPSWMIFSGDFQRTDLRNFIGRTLDIVAGLTLLAVTWPFMLFAALAIKLEDGWRAPVLYRQVRVGRLGRPIEVYKFRSMVVQAEADGVARWAEKNDDRITCVGRFMRLTRIDELPQLLNVLRGDMRFVGPRPERPEFVEELSRKIPYYRERHSVKPGLTGWAQLCYPYGSSQEDAVEKLQYDLYYIKHRSLLFDLAVLVQTVEVVLFGKGAR